MLTVVSELVLIEDAALSLPGDVGYPDAADLDATLVEGRDKVLPQRLVEFLSRQDRDSQPVMTVPVCPARDMEPLQTLTKPLAWAATMVMSSGLGLGLLLGMYCFTDSWRTSFWE
jgi:hypothetical protein